MKRNSVIQLIVSLLVLLFLYAGISKLVEFPGFKAAMHRQPLPGWSKPLLVWIVPLSELVICICLLYDTLIGLVKRVIQVPLKFTTPLAYKKMLLLGLYGSLILLSMFTVYTLAAVFKFFDKVPCSCGGVISKLGWPGHAAMNTGFTLLTILAIYLLGKDQSRLPEQGNRVSPSAYAYKH